MRRRITAATVAICLAWCVLCEAVGVPNAAQAARIAELRPDSVIISRGSDKVSIRGGDLGRFDAQLSPVQNLHNLIAYLALLHDAARSAEFIVAEQMPRFVKFTQLIGGIPVKQRIEVDLDPDGNITEARLTVLDPALAPKRQPITRARAMEIAARACAAKAGAADARVELKNFPGLHYTGAPMGEPLKLQYRFAAEVPNLESSLVTVEAFTGAVQVESADMP
jgi:hypothetical protein